ncbi:MAG: cation:proton antiporter, partial [Gaiella sp.]|uniref:cation:proton antiporter domain-containing protein n=1 Tax=Gaiella sp. TaxID=2663207 RepID=UPI003C7163F3
MALVLLASSLGALLSRLSRRVVLPTVVCEIVLGILIGPEVLGIAEVDPYLQYLSTLGLGLLFFFVGLEVVEHRVPNAVLARGTRGWALSAAAG